MNIQQLKNVIEVWKCGSISKAAKHLYMNQPNLSRSITSLEEEFNITLFSRTSSGVEPTHDGLQFLRQAERMVAEFEEFENSFKHGDKDKLSFKIAVPRVSYLANAFTQAVSANAGEKLLDIEYMEASNEEIINRVLFKGYDIGIIRFPIEFESDYKKRLVEMQLRFQELLTFRFVATMSRRHPLAGKKRLNLGDMKPYIILTHGDNHSVNFSNKETDSLYLRDISDNSITLFERGSQFDFLRNIHGSYMLVSPLPRDVLQANDLVQIPFEEQDVGLFVDLIITRKNRRYSEFERKLIAHIIDVQQQIMPADY
ncbi:MAG: LysR family transcriptional regulator [Oscillospiraceae bacterium]|nr:LysR family transcriptional regulator [Oscillospiraceae bacterium]